MNKLQFLPFDKTYTIVTLTLSLCMIYPNPKTDKWRLAAIPLMIATIVPIGFMISLDMVLAMLSGDWITVIRHSTVFGPFLGGFLKMLLMYYERVTAKAVLDEINADYALFNNALPKYQEIAAASILNSKIYSERYWCFVVLTCVLAFPIIAIVLNVYSQLFASEPQKYMIHDINRPFRDPMERFDSPYFEIMFAYSFYAAVLYILNYIGYDGFFGLSVNHACLKIDLFCEALEDAMKAHPWEVNQRVMEVIKEQCRFFKFINNIQVTFNLWLGIVFIATMIQICCCLYHIVEGYGFDFKYTIFITGVVIHTYLPCRYASKLKAMSATAASRIYSCGWENVQNKTVSKMILFMIARQQVTLEIVACNMIVFDMELFVSVLQTSYSMFTLLRS